jgi:predicted XRE-type DNA-binding protein
MKTQTFDSVWDAFEDNAIEAKLLKLRAKLLTVIISRIEESGSTQQETAKQLGITQPRVNALLKGKIKDFRLDSLVNLAHKLGLTVSVEIAA